MTAPLSQDLRERIAQSVEAGSSARAAAERFAVSPSAAIKLMQRVRQTGSTAPAKMGGHRRPILEPHADTLRAIATSKPGITLKDMCDALHARGIAVKALSTIADMLHRLGLSPKKEPESRRARPSRRGSTPPPLAGVAALHGRGQLRVPGRDRHRYDHDPALWLGRARRTTGRCRALRPSEDDNLRSGSAGERDHRALRARRADERGSVPGLRGAGAGA